MRTPRLPLLAVLPLLLVGCATSQYRWKNNALPPNPNPKVVAIRGVDARPVAWNQIVDAAEWADVVLVGEVHSDAAAHRLQQRLLADVLEREPRTVLSMEFLERNEQPIIDDYLSGVIDVAAFVEATGSANSGAPGKWMEWYQPLIDTAKQHGAPVIGANPPRKLARLAREKGYEALADLPAEEQPLYTLPVTEPSAREMELFRQAMAEAAAAHGGSSDSLPSLEEIRPFLRSQELWNGTMAASILAAREVGAPKVLHIVGGFHIEEQGGIVRELRHRAPKLKIISIQLRDDSLATGPTPNDVIVWTDGWTP